VRNWGDEVEGREVIERGRWDLKMGWCIAQGMRPEKLIQGTKTVASARSLVKRKAEWWLGQK